MKMSPLILSVVWLLGCNQEPETVPEPPVTPDGPVATVYTTSVAGKRFDESTETEQNI